MSRINYNKSSEYLLLSLALPLIGKLLVSELYAIVDTFFVGRFLDRTALSALGLVFPLQRFLNSLPILVGVGTSTMLSRSLGRGDKEEAGKIIFTGALMILVLQSFFVGLAYTRASQLMGFLGASGQGLISSSLYLRYSALGSFFFALNGFISFILLSLGNTRISLVSLIMGAILNMILDPVFLGPLGFGLEGAAIASMISQIIGASYALFFFRKFLKKANLRLNFGLKPGYLLPLFLGGLSAFIIEIEDSFVISVLNSLLLSRDGELGVMVLSIITKLSMFLFITLFGIASAMQPLAAYFYGAKNKKRLKDLLLKTYIFSTLFTSIVWLVFMVKTEFFVGLFLKNPEDIVLTAKIFRLVVMCFPLSSIYYIDIFYAQAKGHARRALIFSLLRQIFLLVPLSIVFVKGFGMGSIGVWISYPITDLTASLLAFISLRKQGLVQVLFPGREKIIKTFRELSFK